MYGNAITFIAGFVFASQGAIDYRLLLLALIGVSLVIASGCVFNNYYDRDIDALMKRTKERPLPRMAISGAYALLFGFFLSIIGFSILYLFTNIVTGKHRD